MPRLGVILKTIALPLLFASALCWAEPKIPNLSGPVIDEAHLLSDEDKQVLTSFLLQFQASGKVQMVIFIAESLQGYDIESFSLAAVEKWKLGIKGQDQGLLLTIVPKERRMRLEVGYGLEGAIPDAYSRRILDNSIRPYFRDGRYVDGLLVAIEEVSKKLGIDLTAPVTDRINQKPQSRPLPFFLLLILIMLFVGAPILMAPFLPRSSSSRRYNRDHDSWGGGGFGGGGFGGGGFGGGGGGFGGGGSSSSW